VATTEKVYDVPYVRPENVQVVRTVSTQSRGAANAGVDETV
jgi:hypothetical protein